MSISSVTNSSGYATSVSAATATSASSPASPIPDGLASTGDTTAQAPQSTKDQFLRLLVAQIQYQDPLAPQDATTFMTQLAQLSQVEASSETNTRLADLQSAQSASLRAGYSNLVGRTATARVKTVHEPQTSDQSIVVKLDGAATDVTVNVVDKNGKTVWSKDFGPAEKGDLTVPWPVKDATPPEEGDYTIQVVATGGTKDKPTNVDAAVELRGVITSIAYEGSSVVLSIGDNEITPSDIAELAR